MPKSVLALIAFAFLFTAVHNAAAQSPAAAAESAYPTMAPLDQYLIADKAAEIALARSAAPASVSGEAEIMVLEKTGYTTAVKGTNGFMCLVERGWGHATTGAQFWNPSVRAPHCFNPAAARTFAPIYLYKTKLVLAGKSKAEIGQLIAAAFDKKDLPALEPSAMVYMMSRQQYLNDTGKAWHPHLMFLASGDVAKSWGANLPDSPVIAGADPEEHTTIFMVVLPTWSDNTPGPAGAN
jgi:hypothetical protein